MKIVILAGGLSPERDVSLSSGSLIANALRNTGHRVLLLDVYEGISVDESEALAYGISYEELCNEIVNAVM